MLRNRAVAVGPGLTQFTRTRCSRISYARQRVKCTMAALIVEYATSGDVPKWPAAEAMLITDPLRRLTIPGTTDWHISIVPIRLRLRSARTSSIEILQRVVRVRLAALRANVAAGGVHEYRDRPDLRLDLGNHRLDAAFVRDVADHRARLGAVLRQVCLGRVEIGEFAVLSRRRLALIVNRHRRTEFGEPQRNRVPQPTTGAGHQRHLPGQ